MDRELTFVEVGFKLLFMAGLLAVYCFVIFAIGGVVAWSTDCARCGWFAAGAASWVLIGDWCRCWREIDDLIAYERREKQR